MADKKISELPLLNSVSGSSIIVPIVHDGTTVKLNLSQLGQYASQWSAKTGSANTFTGNQTINGNLSVSGKITVNELVAVYETASVVFSSGSNVFGDAPNDIHQFTGSVDVNGTFLLNGSAIGLGQINAFTQSVESQLSKVYNATASLEQFTSSQDGRNFIISQYTASTDAHIVGISAFTSSQLAVNTGLASVTASINSFTSSQLAVNTGLASVSASLNNFTASQDTRNFIISQFTASTNNHIVGISAFTSSQLGVNLGNSIYTASVDNHIVGISAFTSSQLAVNLGISSVTGSLIGITNALMGFTASLDNTFATDAQLYQLYQATRSIELHSGSIIGITNGLMAYTASNETWKTGVRGEISAIEAWTASLDNTYATDAQLYQLYQATRSIELHSGSMIGITNGLMAYTSSNETWKTGVRGEINGVESYTASLKAAAIVSSSTQIQNYDLFALNSNLYTATGSIQSQLNGIESYTASLKTAAIVSSSTQITNYYKFAETASANTFYGNQTFNNDVRANKFVFTDGVINTNVGGQYVIATSGNVTYLYTGTSGLNINDATNGNINVSISNVGAVQTRGKLTVGAPGNDQDIAFGGSNAKLDWAGTGAQIAYNVGALQFSSVGTTNNMILQQQAGALFNAGITGSLMATNNVVSSSIQVQNYNLFALTASANTFYGTQTFSGSFNLSGSMQQTGLSTLIGNTVLSGSIAMSGSTTQIGNNTIVGNTVLSGSINVSGSSNFNNSEFRVTGSSFFTGSHTITGNSIFSGSINIASGSSYYRAGNKLFNYGQWGSLEIQSGSANTAYAMKLGTQFNGVEGVYVANNGSGFPTRITVQNTGLYNIEFSSQLTNTNNTNITFDIWFAYTGSNITNSNTQIDVNKSAGQLGRQVAAWNLLTPIQANDYVELMWSCDAATGQLYSMGTQTSPDRPAVPSVIVTITQHA